MLCEKIPSFKGGDRRKGGCLKGRKEVREGERITPPLLGKGIDRPVIQDLPGWRSSSVVTKREEGVYVLRKERGEESSFSGR